MASKKSCQQLNTANNWLHTACLWQVGPYFHFKNETPVLMPVDQQLKNTEIGNFAPACHYINWLMIEWLVIVICILNICAYCVWNTHSLFTAQCHSSFCGEKVSWNECVWTQLLTISHSERRYIHVSWIMKENA